MTNPLIRRLHELIEHFSSDFTKLQDENYTLRKKVKELEEKYAKLQGATERSRDMLRQNMQNSDRFLPYFHLDSQTRPETYRKFETRTSPYLGREMNSNNIHRENNSHRLGDFNGRESVHGKDPVNSREQCRDPINVRGLNSTKDFTNGRDLIEVRETLIVREFNGRDFTRETIGQESEREPVARASIHYRSKDEKGISMENSSETDDHQIDKQSIHNPIKTQLFPCNFDFISKVDNKLKYSIDWTVTGSPLINFKLFRCYNGHRKIKDLAWLQKPFQDQNKYLLNPDCVPSVLHLMYNLLILSEHSVFLLTGYSQMQLVSVKGKIQFIPVSKKKFLEENKTIIHFRKNEITALRDCEEPLDLAQENKDIQDIKSIKSSSRGKLSFYSSPKNKIPLGSDSGSEEAPEKFNYSNETKDLSVYSLTTIPMLGLFLVTEQTISFFNLNLQFINSWPMSVSKMIYNQELYMIKDDQIFVLDGIKELSEDKLLKPDLKWANLFQQTLIHSTIEDVVAMEGCLVVQQKDKEIVLIKHVHSSTEKRGCSKKKGKHIRYKSDNSNHTGKSENIKVNANKKSEISQQARGRSKLDNVKETKNSKQSNKSKKTEKVHSNNTGDSPNHSISLDNAKVTELKEVNNFIIINTGIVAQKIKKYSEKTVGLLIDGTWECYTVIENANQPELVLERLDVIKVNIGRIEASVQKGKIVINDVEAGTTARTEDLILFENIQRISSLGNCLFTHGDKTLRMWWVGEYK